MSDIKETYVGIQNDELVEIGSVGLAEDGYFDELVRSGISVVRISTEQLEAIRTRLFEKVTIRLEQRPVCEWKEHPEDGYWQSACGEQWCFVDGGVKENRVRFCHGCGGKVEVV